MSDPVIMTSSRPRAGRRFEPIHELELDEDALNAARSLPGAHRGLLVLREPTGPFGIPDLVAVVGDPRPLQERLRISVAPLLNQVDAGIVSATAPKAPRTASTLAARLGWTTDVVERRIPGLVRSGALLEVGRDSYVREPALQLVGRLYAIETKVKDWRRALRQARTYNVWCDSYVLVMPQLGTASVHSLTEAVESDSAGLVVEGRWIRRPRLKGVSAAQRLWGSEHVVAGLRTPSD